MRHFALVLALAASAAVASAADQLDGKWQLVNISALAESTAAIVTVETKDGAPVASVCFSPPNVETTVTGFKVGDSTVTLAIRQTRTIQGRQISSDIEFIGVRGKDAKVILGSTAARGSDDRVRTRAKLVATDKTELAQNEITVRIPPPEPMAAVQKLNSRVTTLMLQANREMDADKKKELTKQVTEARQDADEKAPALYRETVAKHADSPAALDAALNLIRSARRVKLTAAEANGLVALIRHQCDLYGPRFAIVTLVQVAEALVAQKGLEAAALSAAEPAGKALTDALPTMLQSRVLTAYKSALEKNGKSDQAQPIAARLNVLETKLDAEYLEKVPPFKPEAFAGRKEKGANQVVVMELFTGAQCPPCVAADVAFDALGKAYKPSELVLIQYHMHIPGPDPMVNPDCIARWDYYREKFRNEVRGTPSTMFNGKPQAGGGGAMAGSENKFKQYRGIIDPLLEKSTAINVAGKASRNGDKIEITVDVVGADAEDLKLRLVVVEDVVKFVGSNNLRFHHHVVRALPGGAAGVAVKGKAFHHAVAANIAEIRQGLDKYLTAYAEDERPFPQPGRPLDLKHLKVIALVQNDANKEIVQAAQIDIDGR